MSEVNVSVIGQKLDQSQVKVRMVSSRCLDSLCVDWLVAITVIRNVPIDVNGVADEPQFAVRPCDLRAKPMAASITRPRQRLRGVRGGDGCAVGGRDVLAILNPMHRSACGSGHVRGKLNLIARRRAQHVSRVDCTIARMRRHFEKPVVGSCHINKDMAGADAVENRGR